MVDFWQVIRSRSRSLEWWRGASAAIGRRPAAALPAAAVAADLEPPPGAYVAVIVNGFENGELDKILDTVAQESAAAGFRPLIVTRAIDLAATRRRGMPVDFVNDQGPHASEPDLPWRRRMEAQIRGLVRLWEPVAVASFAQPSAVDLVDSVRTAIEMHRGVPSKVGFTIEQRSAGSADRHGARGG
jgi:hypothetical protein